MNHEPRLCSEPGRSHPQMCSVSGGEPNSSSTPLSVPGAPSSCRGVPSSCGEASRVEAVDLSADSTLALAGLRAKARALACPRGVALSGFGMFAALLLWQDDRARVFAALPYIVLLAFPLLHLFLLRGERASADLDTANVAHEGELRSR